MEKKTKKSASKKETKKVDFKEFKYTGKVFEYSGRIYSSKEGKGKVLRTWGLQLVLNGVFTLKGVYLVETESTVFLKYPQYQKDKEYVSYVFIDKELNKEIDGLIAVLMNVVGIGDGDGDDEIAVSDDSELPF